MTLAMPYLGRHRAGLDHPAPHRHGSAGPHRCVYVAEHTPRHVALER